METPSIRKPSVTFDPYPTFVESHDSVTSPNIDIHAQAIPDSIMVGLVDRPTEMKELTRCNQHYFEALKHYLGDDTWPVFEDIIYSERSKIPDNKWMKQISKMLGENPPLLESFRELVGFMEDVSQDEEEDEDSDETLVYLRESQEELDRFIATHSQFFEDCKTSLGEDEYDKFMKTLYTSRDKLSDEEWKSALHARLEKHPALLGQFQKNM